MRRKSLLAIILTASLAAGCLLYYTSTPNLEERITTREIETTKKGHIERKTVYDTRRHITEHTATEYADEKKEESRIIQYPNGATEVVEKPQPNTRITTKYNPDGKQTEQYREEYIPHDNSTNYSYITTSFDSNGNMAERRVEVFNKENEFVRGFTEKYNKEGEILKTEPY